MAQNNGLNFIRNQKDLMILFSDKNIGPMVVNRDDYTKAMMDQHLSSRSACEIVAKEEAEEFLPEARSAFINCISLKGNDTKSNHMKHVMRCLDQDTRIPVMYGLGKSCEGKFPLFLTD